MQRKRPCQFLSKGGLALFSLTVTTACPFVFTHDIPPDAAWINCGYPRGFAYAAPMRVTTDCFVGGDANVVVRGETPGLQETRPAVVEVEDGTEATWRATVYHGEPTCLLVVHIDQHDLVCEQETFVVEQEQEARCRHGNGEPAECHMRIRPPEDLMRDLSGSRQKL